MRLFLISGLLSTLMLVSAPLSAQTDFTPDPDKATVYFVRTSAMGAAINFKYFVDEQYLGKVNYGKYLKVTLEPGTHLLWAKAENIAYLEAKLEAGQTYVVNAKTTMGMVKAGVNLSPVSPAQGKKADKAVRVLLKHQEKKYTEDERAQEATEWTDLIARSSEKYEDMKAQNRDIQSLDQAMDLSALATRKK